jgi:hypothetical protein
MTEALSWCAWCSNSYPTHMVLDPCGLFGSNIGYIPSLHLTSPAVVAEVKLRQTPPNDWNYSVSISSSKTSSYILILHPFGYFKVFGMFGLVDEASSSLGWSFGEPFEL